MNSKQLFLCKLGSHWPHLESLSTHRLVKKRIYFTKASGEVLLIFLSPSRLNRCSCFICFFSLQEEVVKLLAQQQLEVCIQLCGQALHGDGGQRRLLRGCQAADGGQTLGGGVQPSQTPQTGSGLVFSVYKKYNWIN